MNCSSVSFAEPRVGRGAAYADINNDGALDVPLTTTAAGLTCFAMKAQPTTACASSWWERTVVVP